MSNHCAMIVRRRPSKPSAKFCSFCGCQLGSDEDNIIKIRRAKDGGLFNIEFHYQHLIELVEKNKRESYLPAIPWQMEEFQGIDKFLQEAGDNLSIAHPNGQIAKKTKLLLTDFLQKSKLIEVFDNPATRLGERLQQK